MTSTFLVEIQVESIDSVALEQQAQDMHEQLLADGFDVLGVKPWEHPSLTAAKIGGLPTITPLGAEQ